MENVSGSSGSCYGGACLGICTAPAPAAGLKRWGSVSSVFTIYRVFRGDCARVVSERWIRCLLCAHSAAASSARSTAQTGMEAAPFLLHPLFSHKICLADRKIVVLQNVKEAN